jgi:hypothetical protein
MLPYDSGILQHCLQRELASLCPTPTLIVHHLSAVRYCIFGIYAATLHIWRSFLRPQPEESPCRGDGDSLITQIYIFIRELDRIRRTHVTKTASIVYSLMYSAVICGSGGLSSYHLLLQFLINYVLTYVRFA